MLIRFTRPLSLQPLSRAAEDWVFLLAHADCNDFRPARNPSGLPNSANSFCSGTAPSSFYLSIGQPVSPWRYDRPGRPHALFLADDPPAAPSTSSISPSNAPNVFVRASLPDSPLCPVCDIESRKSCFDCDQHFCANHIYSCADCGNQYCGDCLDAHRADGHWADSDTALEFASTQGTVRGDCSLARF